MAGSGELAAAAGRTLRRCALAAGLGCAAAVVHAQPAAGANAGPEVRDVRGFLLRIHEAASQRNFHGTFIVSGGGTMSSSRIAHYCEGRDQVERIDSLDGERRQLLRHNDTVHVVWPASRVVQVEHRDAIKNFPALLQVGDDRIAEHYQVFRQGSDRVAGRDAEVALVRPRDAWRYGYRLWSDKASGLLLRADVIGEEQAVLETAAFTEVAIGVRAQPEAVLGAMRKLDGVRVVRPLLRPAQLEAEGWTLRDAVPGFRLVSCLKRQLDPAPGGRADEVLHAVLADGLTHVSLFIERYEPNRHPRAFATSVGATQTLMRRHGEAWVTAVGDVPLPTLRQFAAALERRR